MYFSSHNTKIIQKQKTNQNKQKQNKTNNNNNNNNKKKTKKTPNKPDLKQSISHITFLILLSKMYFSIMYPLLYVIFASDAGEDSKWW